MLNLTISEEVWQIPLMFGKYWEHKKVKKVKDCWDEKQILRIFPVGEKLSMWLSCWENSSYTYIYIYSFKSWEFPVYYRLPTSPSFPVGSVGIWCECCQLGKSFRDGFWLNKELHYLTISKFKLECNSWTCKEDIKSR